ncbi:NUDIX hydrolase [Nocardioides mangrovi]|uniref:NUDIX domain-containing protein n=1 Tax=Nocardioides mangrovi TaxID=2874580 RepID=A0ABS7UJ96_9ACTN|nr:NUDIX domain-containing protein [Nocardioides mangrovi]MBZ5741101.1 NUDIX domain-containing protein [Nocardioides mangrovi]
MSRRPVRERHTGRVLPVNSRGEVLLLHGWDPVRPERPFWFTIGGAVEGEEYLVEAAAREMREEIGVQVRAADLTASIARATVEFDWGMWHFVQHQTFYAIALEDTVELSFDGLEPLERATTDEAGWWTPDALDAAGTAADHELTSHMRIAIRTILGETDA